MTDRLDSGDRGVPRRGRRKPETQQEGALSRRMRGLGPRSGEAQEGAARFDDPPERRAALPPPPTFPALPGPRPTPPATARRASALRRAAAQCMWQLAGALPAAPHSGAEGEIEFHPRTLALDDAPRSPIESAVMVALCALLATALVWAFLSRMSNYTEAQGKVQTLGRTKVVEALAPGKVVEIVGQDGDKVKAGDAVIQLDPTDALAVRAIVAAKLTDLRAETQREQTEIDAAHAAKVDASTRIDWGKDVPGAVRRREDAVIHADLAKLAAQIATLQASKAAKEAERDKFAKDIEAQKALVAVTQENLAMIETLMKQGFNSQAKYLDTKAMIDGQQVQQTSYEGSLEGAKQAILMVDSEIAKTREVFVTSRIQQVSDNLKAIVDLEQQLVRAGKVLADMTLRTPVSGVIHATAVTTLGQVVKPGDQLMQVVPDDQTLEIEAYVSNADVGFIRKGDPAVIKVQAFIYNVYGAIDGTVTSVANDASALQGKPTLQSSSLDGTASSTTAAEKTGNLRYPIHVRAARSTMLIEGKEIPLVPGMSVSVEIETERLRAIDYVLSPIEELFSTAGHER